VPLFKLFIEQCIDAPSAIDPDIDGSIKGLIDS